MKDILNEESELRKRQQLVSDGFTKLKRNVVDLAPLTTPTDLTSVDDLDVVISNITNIRETILHLVASDRTINISLEYLKDASDRTDSALYTLNKDINRTKDVQNELSVKSSVLETKISTLEKEVNELIDSNKTRDANIASALNLKRIVVGIVTASTILIGLLTTFHELLSKLYSK